MNLRYFRETSKQASESMATESNILCASWTEAVFMDGWWILCVTAVLMERDDALVWRGVDVAASV